MNTLFDDTEATRGDQAEFSPCGLYRYLLTRRWRDGHCVTFLMFNPSTATAELDDPTIRRCIGFAKLWGYGRMNIVNLYAIRSTDPKAVARTVDPEGPMNDFWITRAAQESREIICAWGCAQHVPSVNARVKRVIDLIELEAFSVQLNCLGYRKDGHPRHPLMLSYKSPRQQFFWRAA